MRFSKVAASWWPEAFARHPLESCPHPPCVQQYLDVLLRRNVVLSGVFRGALPVLLLPVGAGCGTIIVCCICCKSLRISSWTGSVWTELICCCWSVTVLISVGAMDGCKLVGGDAVEFVSIAC